MANKMKTVYRSIQKLVQEVETPAKKSYEENPNRDHIYYDVVRVKNWLSERPVERSVSAANVHRA